MHEKQAGFQVQIYIFFGMARNVLRIFNKILFARHLGRNNRTIRAMVPSLLPFN